MLALVLRFLRPAPSGGVARWTAKLLTEKIQEDACGQGFLKMLADPVPGSSVGRPKSAVV